MQSGDTVIKTGRLILRHWRECDLEPFADLNADPAVGEFLGGPFDRTTSDALAARIQSGMDQRGWGLWAVERIGGERFIGFTGLAPVPFPAAFAPATEIGWRLARSAWGQGYATEAARAVLAHAFGPLGFETLVSFTAIGNRRSRRVMERIGMRQDPTGDFMHPAMPPVHPLAHHVLYRISAAEWRDRARLVTGAAQD